MPHTTQVTDTFVHFLYSKYWGKKPIKTPSVQIYILKNKVPGNSKAGRPRMSRSITDEFRHGTKTLHHQRGDFFFFFNWVLNRQKSLFNLINNIFIKKRILGYPKKHASHLDQNCCVKYQSFSWQPFLSHGNNLLAKMRSSKTQTLMLLNWWGELRK